MQKIYVIVKLMFFYKPKKFFISHHNGRSVLVQQFSFHLQSNINTGYKTCKSMAMLGML